MAGGTIGIGRGRDFGYFSQLTSNCASGKGSRPDLESETPVLVLLLPLAQAPWVSGAATLPPSRTHNVRATTYTMPYKDREIEKQYFTIGEVAAQFNVAPSLIRFWETEFEELRPRKSKKGNRLYTPQDIDIFRTIYHLVKERGYTIPGARDMLKQKGPQLKEKIDVIQSLEKIRKFMVTMKKELDAIGKAQG
ncbi:hypothetical protein GCM10027346_01580 [Hymenobacter seoulensis]